MGKFVKEAASPEVTKRVLQLLENSGTDLKRTTGFSSFYHGLDPKNIRKFKTALNVAGENAFISEVSRLHDLKSPISSAYTNKIRSNKAADFVAIRKGNTAIDKAPTDSLLHEVGHKMVRKRTGSEIRSTANDKIKQEFEANRAARNLITRYSSPENLDSNLYNYKNNLKSGMNSYKRNVYTESYNEYAKNLFNSEHGRNLLANELEKIAPHETTSPETRSSVMTNIVKKWHKKDMMTNPIATTRYNLKANIFGEMK